MYSIITDSFKIVVITLRLLFLFCCVTCESLFRIILPISLKSLDNETILVTGAASGIGRAICLEIMKVTNGKAKLVCWDINGKQLDILSTELRQIGGTVLTYVVDVSDKEQVRTVSNTVKQDVGNVTMLINNAGILPVVKLLDQKTENIELTMSVNVLSHFWILREFLPEMITRNSGHIVAIASAGSFIANRNFVVYHASKFAVNGYMEALEDELLEYHEKCNIKLTTVYPSYVNTSFAVNKANSSLETVSKFREPSDIAKDIVCGVRRNYSHIYLPSFISKLAFLKILPYKVQLEFKKLVPTHPTPPEPSQ